MLIIAFTAIAILAWLGAALFANSRRSEQPGARADEPGGAVDAPSRRSDTPMTGSPVEAPPIVSGRAGTPPIARGSKDAMQVDDDRLSAVADEAMAWLEQQNDTA